jgi:hypothetical protein
LVLGKSLELYCGGDAFSTTAAISSVEVEGSAAGSGACSSDIGSRFCQGHENFSLGTAFSSTTAAASTTGGATGCELASSSALGGGGGELGIVRSTALRG